MKRWLSAVVLSLISFSVLAQSDFIQLKKHHKVIQSWYKDNDITFLQKDGSSVTALIDKIRDDSLYMRPYQVFYYTTRSGINMSDTVFYGTMTIHYQSIYGFPKQDEGSGLIKKGTLFKVGGGGFLLLNIINTLSNNQPVFGADNLPKLGIAAGVLAAGIALGLSHNSDCTIGKKYHVEYISAKPSS
jgi:hypothetical protein